MEPVYLTEYGHISSFADDSAKLHIESECPPERVPSDGPYAEYREGRRMRIVIEGETAFVKRLAGAMSDEVQTISREIESE